MQDTSVTCIACMYTSKYTCCFVSHACNLYVCNDIPAVGVMAGVAVVAAEVVAAAACEAVAVDCICVFRVNITQ